VAVNLNSSLPGDVIQNLDPSEVDASPAINTTRIDQAFVVKAGGTITYNSSTNKSTIPKPYTHIQVRHLLSLLHKPWKMVQVLITVLYISYLLHQILPCYT
jgi:UDP-N-acetyl-D-mannosaminuronic acid transferase (WecB/TagA/CpsF family)